MDDEAHGQGTLTWDGNMYVGEFKHNRRHGEGVLTDANGEETLGEWRFDKPWNAVVYRSSGKFKMSYKDGVPQ